MEINKQKEITEKLSEAVLSAKTDQERVIAVNAYNSWLKTLSGIEASEAETKLKKDIHDDELINRRDDMEMQCQKDEEERIRQKEEKENLEKQQRLQFYVDNGLRAMNTMLTAVTTCVMVKTVKTAVKAELNGEPTFGWLKTITQSFTRTLFTIKK